MAWQLIAAPLIDLAGKIFDRVIPDPEKAAAAKLELFKMVQDGSLQELTQRAGIVKAEAESTHFLAANWRPILMLTFGALIVARWFGWTAPNLTENEYLKLWDIVELGIGGYVIGRSAEKVVPAIADAIKNR
jgi:hypothetical protein